MHTCLHVGTHTAAVCTAVLEFSFLLFLDVLVLLLLSPSFFFFFLSLCALCLGVLCQGGGMAGWMDRWTPG